MDAGGSSTEAGHAGSAGTGQDVAGAGGSGAVSSGGTGGAAGDAGFGCGKLLFRETFEDGAYLDSFDQPTNTGAVKVVVSADGATPYAGDACLRGNFRVGDVDPITQVAATSRYSGLEIPLGGSRGFAVALRYRVDPDARWVMDDGMDTGLGYKFFYLMGTPWNNTLNWVLAQLWGPEHWWFGDNQPSGNTGYTIETDADPAHAKLGEYHLIEIFAALNSEVGNPDGLFRLRVDGTTYHEKSDVPWQTSTEQTFGTLGGVPDMYGGCCGPKLPFGWQIDDVEVWTLPDGCVPP